MSNTISVTRALATIKNLDSKIERAIPNLQLIAVSEGTGNSLVLVDSKVSVEDFTAKAKAAEKALTDMIAERAKLKAAVIKSNAETTVVVGKTTMTVAEAIEAKKSVGFKAQLLVSLRKQLVQATNKYNQLNGVFQHKLDTAEAQATSRDKKVNQEEVALATAGIKLRQTPGVQDPLSLSAYIEALDDEIQDFVLNVDFALSEVNAKTEIVV